MKDLDIHKKFILYGRNAREWMRQCVLLLPEIERRRIWKKKGFSSIYEYAAKLAGMSRDKVNEGLRVLHRIEDKPALMKVAQEKGVLAVKPVAAIATKEDASFWAEKAREMSKHTLEVFVRDTRRPGTATKPAKITISMQLSPEIAAKLEKLKGQDEWEDLMKEFLELREERLQTGRPLPSEAKSRYIPAKIRKHVIRKTRGFCAHPNCKQRFAHLHHTEGFELAATHNPNKIVPLCKAHHDIAHLGLIENEQSAPEFWQNRVEADVEHPRYHTDRLVQKFRARSP